MEELLEFFKDEGVPIQITLDPDKRVTVNALYKKEVGERHYVKMTEAATLIEALEQMKVKLFG
jgi:hypothetical protein